MKGMKRRPSSLFAMLRLEGILPPLAGLLLACFLAGGAAAPTLHLVHHAQEQVAAQEAAPRCLHGSHDAPAAERGGVQFTTEQCWVLARHVLNTPPMPAEGPAPVLYESRKRAIVLALHASSVEGKSVIRGPPSRLL